MAQILVVEDNETMREGIAQILSKMGHEPKTAAGGRSGVELFEQTSPDFVITDLKMEEMDGIEVLKRIRRISPEALIMIITAFGTIETAVDAMKLGAFDFITKPFSPDLLRLKVATALDLVRIKAENRFLRSEIQRDYPAAMVGDSRLLKALKEQIAKVAPTDAAVLITGETGTGKELVARAIHAQSARSDKPFIKVDCAALSEAVLESELFGHERGAFTGANQRKPGRFELADGGTVFLDEVSEIPPHLQAKLLRVIQEKAFERVGGARTLHVDVRILSTTNRELSVEVQTGKFREDLFHRLQAVPIDVPALRHRREDIGALIDFFVMRLSGGSGRKVSFTPEAITALRAYDWPGNIRELEQTIERLHALHPGERIDRDGLPGGLKISNNPVDLSSDVGERTLDQALEELEKRLILKAYGEAQGVKTRTAELLGIKTSALYYKLEKYGIHTKD